MSPKGGEPDRLAQLIHDNSPRARRGFIKFNPAEAESKPMQRVALDHATRGSLYLGGRKLPEDASFLLDSLHHRTYDIRLFAASIAWDVAQRTLGSDLWRAAATIEIPSLEDRREELPSLIQVLAREAIDAELILGGPDIEALQNFACEVNLDGLRKTVAALAHVGNQGSLRKAATHLA